jgi:tetratricopeptide (TPR) repeat protein
MRIEKAQKHYEEGIDHFRCGKISDAEKAFKKAIKYNSKHADAYNDLGNLYLQKGQFKESFNAYRKALALAPNHPLLLNNIGNCLTRQGEHEKALHWLNKAIKLDPDNATAHCNSGNALRCLGYHPRAVAAYRCAIELNPRHAFYYINLGQVLIELDELDEAVENFNRALKINPEEQSGYLGLGKAWNAQGDLEQAVSCYQKAISIDPGNAKCYSGLGIAFEDHGETEKAIAALHKAIEIDPESESVYPILVRNKKFITFDADMKAMESLFSRKNNTDAQKSQLAFSLGKAYEDLGKYDKSIEYVIQAARLKRNFLDFSIADSKARFDRIKNVFSPDFFSDFPDIGHSDRTPIFILGMPRSGTSLVEQILASHPEVFGAGELNDLARVYQLLDDSFDSLQGDSFPEALVGLDADEYANLGKQYIARIRKHSSRATYITDKNPLNFERIGFIRSILPDARIVHCTRDPLDNCLSLLKTDFQHGQLYSYDMSELGEYYTLYQELMEYWRATLPGFIHDFKYEDLVANQEEQTKRLLQLCGLPWADACMDFHRTRRKVRTASNAQVSRPIYQDSVNLWKRYENFLEPLISALNR